MTTSIGTEAVDPGFLTRMEGLAKLVAPRRASRRPEGTSIAASLPLPPFNSPVAVAYPRTMRSEGRESAGRAIGPRGQLALAAVVAFVAVGGFLALYGAHHGTSGATLGATGLGLLALGAGLAFFASRRGENGVPIGLLAVAAAAGLVAALALCDLFHLRPYLLLPVDLLGFSESPFVTDLIKLRLGEPLYTPLPDNNSFPYSCGTQVLTYSIASLLGDGTSIPLLRCVQFSYVLGAVVVATAAMRSILRASGPAAHSPMWPWSILAAAFLVLVATDGRFNLYTHALHNDGLVLLLSACGLWLLVENAHAPRRWHALAMVLLPVVGFSVKQSALIWAGLFAAHFLFERRLRWSLVVAYGLCTGALAGLVVGASWWAWGDPYLEWTFVSLSLKNVSYERVLEHGFAAAGYLALGLAGGVALVLRPQARRLLWPWLMSLGLFGAEIYTSGVAVVSNHIGPGALLLSTWSLAAFALAWRDGDAAEPAWRRLVLLGAQVGIPVAAVGALQLYRAPKNVLSGDFPRYVAAIEREFEGLPAEQVLLDAGSWIYLREGVLMRDRSAPVSLHVGSNQTEITRTALADTIERIRARSYARILARELDTPRTRYDFGDRGSGVKAAILENYRIVRRIPGVRNVLEWWPPHLVSEVVVLEPIEPATR